ncbi:MAG: hypothetical protein IH568_01130 [Burkholderiaceae bacterium]|jgi:hypothetical protein|nr:hypothetical protein [Burkholderiaceae bacterium]
MNHLHTLMTVSLAPMPLPDFPAFDHARAKREGWKISIVPIRRGLERYRLDPHPESFPLKSPEKAWEVVIRAAQGGSGFHADTLRFLLKATPDEWHLISRYASVAMGIDLAAIV